jgi:hypothetical protein
VEGDVGEFSRNGEDDVEIANRQQVGFTRSQPFPRLRSLAFGAVPVTAAIVGDAPVAAVFASFDVATLHSCAACLDG